MAAKGDKVLYWPDLTHCLEIDSHGDYLWTFIFQNGPREGQPASANEINKARRQMPGMALITDQSFQIVPTAPRFAWKATIDGLNEDGTADLTVEHPRGGIQLIYRSVPHSTSNRLHTWHEQET
jgi:hypothetical protein